MRLFTSTHGDQVFYHIHGETDTHLLTGYAQPPEPQGLTIKKFQPIFYDAIYLEKAVRVVAFRDFVTATNGSGWVTIYVWQTNIARNNLTFRFSWSFFNHIVDNGLSYSVGSLVKH